MSQRAFSRGATALALAAATIVAQTAPQVGADRAGGDDRPAVAARAPLQFVPNMGQWRDDVRFAADLGAVRHWLAADGLWVACETGDDLGAALRFAFDGSSLGEGRAVGVEPQATRRHWLRGDAQVSGVGSFARVVQAGLYAGTDLVLRGGGTAAAPHVEYDLVLAPGADLSAVRVTVSGHERMRLLPDGSLSFDTVVGELRQSPPITWATDARGERHELQSRFVVLGEDRFGFAVDGWDGGELTIDPGLIWGTFLGGTGFDRVRRVRADSAGRTVVAGSAGSGDFPTTAGSYRPSVNGADDGFAAVFDAGGAMAWCTYFGGALDEVVDDLRVLPGDRIAISGSTASFNFPVSANRFQGAIVAGGGTDAFVVILPQNGASLEYGSYVGGIGDQRDVYVRVQPNGNIHLAGITTATIPTTGNAFQGINNGGTDVFYLVLDRSLPGSTSLRYGSYFGGPADEERVDSLHVDANEICTIGVTTRSTNLATSPTRWQPSLVGTPPCGYILCFQGIPGAPGPATFVYGSYFGDAGGSTERLMVEVDTSGFFLCVATTSSPNWLTSAISAQPSYGGGASDGVVTRFDAGSTTGLLIATYLGGSGDEVLHDVKFDFNVTSTELASVVGTTTSTNFPVTPTALQPTPNGTGRSAFLQQVDFRAPGPLMRRYSTYFDSCDLGDDALYGVDTDGSQILVGGSTTGNVAPGTGSFQVRSAGGEEGLVARLDAVAQPRLYRTSGGGCGTPGFVPTFDPTTTQPPRMCRTFSTNVNNLRANNVGIMVMGLSNVDWSGIPLPFDLGGQGMPGCTLQVSLDETFVQFHGGTSASFGFNVPGSMAFYGIGLYLQFFELDQALNAAGFANSNVAELNIQF